MSQNFKDIPIIAIDGPSASGKGTIARKLAKHFNFNYLNSGALYRLVAYQASKLNIPFENKIEIANLGRAISPIFLDEKVIIDGVDLWPEISKEEAGLMAAKISPYPELRDAILELQRKQQKPPGLVAEGRDMTYEVFPYAKVKIFLDVKPEIAAKRRYQDELNKGLKPNLEELIQMLQKRDYADRNRERGALKIVPEAFYIDTSHLDKDQVFEKALNYCLEKLKI